MTALTPADKERQKTARGPYQLLPPLSEDEYAALRDDIKSAGVRVPIDVDENGTILDGHHRKAIADELGVECPERVIRDLPEFAKVDYALSVNLARRHLSGEQKSKLVKASLKRDPRLSNREHARRCGVAHSFVAGLRAVLEDAGQLDSESGRLARIGADGKQYPAAHAPQVDSESTSSTDGNRAAGSESPVDRHSRSDQPVVAGPGTATEGVAGQDPQPATPEEKSTPAKWDPAERKAHEEEVRRRQDIESARRTAETIVTAVRTLVVTVVTGSRYGEKGLVSRDMIADLRKAIDLLEGEIDDAQ